MEVVGGIIVVVLLVYLLMLVFGIVSYIFESLGLYTIAKRRGINKPWMAWVPVLSVWTIGCISDQYQYVAKGREKSRRKVLIWLYILTVVLTIALCIAYGWFLVDMESGMSAMGEAYVEDTAWIAESVAPLMMIYAGSMVISVISIVYAVFMYMSLYDLYCSCNPNNGVLFLVLSIFFGVAQPFLIFASRNKDLGMPPRRDQMFQQPVWQPPQPTWQPPVQNYQPPTWQPPVQNPQAPTWQSPVQNPQAPTWQSPVQNPQPPAWQPPVSPVEDVDNKSE